MKNFIAVLTTGDLAQTISRYSDLALAGLVVPTLRPLYDYAWFVGFFVGGGLYLALARRPVK